ncbi:MAG TPA: dienelactone hydrolase family protein [Stellaceae bacterium]|nr:dienelactone hydrolase family protein [Stellaceae bacterium]
MGEIITLAAEDGHRFSAYRADPAGKSKGALVVVQEIYGVNEHIRSVCDDYAKHGYRAIAPALYDRQQRCAAFGYGGEEIQRIRALRAGIDWAKTLPLDIAATIEALRPLRVGIVGYCLGGSVAWMAACRLGVAAASCYYPTDMAKQYTDTARAPAIVHFAERDHVIARDVVEKFIAAQPNVPTYIYPAEHGFNCWHRPTTSYDEASSKLALERTLALFERHVAQ